MREQRGTLRVLAVICHSHKLFLVFGSLFSDVRTDYNLDLRILVNFNDNGGFVVGTHKHFSWYTRGLCSQVTQRTNKS